MELKEYKGEPFPVDNFDEKGEWFEEISSILIPEEIFQIPASVGLSIDRTQMIIVDNVDGCFVTMLNKHEALTLADNLMKLAMEMTS